MDALMGYGSGSDSEALDESMANSTGGSGELATADEADASESEDAVPPTAALDTDSNEGVPQIGVKMDIVAPIAVSVYQELLRTELPEGGPSPLGPVATSNTTTRDEVASPPKKDEICSPAQDLLTQKEAPQSLPPQATLGSPLAKAPSKSPLPPPSSAQPKLLDREASRRLAEDAAAGPWGDQLDCLSSSLNCALDTERLGLVKCPSSTYGEYGSLKVLCSRSAHLLGMTADKEGAIVLGRKCVIDADAMLRGDLARVQLGAHCFVGTRTVLRPPRRIAFAEDTSKAAAPSTVASTQAIGEDATSSSFSSDSPPAPPALPPQRVCAWTKLTVGSHVVFGRDCVVEASSVGSFVRVGDGCVFGANCVVKDCVWLMPGCLLPPGTIVAPFSIMSGAPAQRVGELPESAAEEFRLHAERTCRRRVYQKV